MSLESRPADERLRFLADPVVLAELDLTVADLADPDTRSLVIRREHPELEEALEVDHEDVDLYGEPFNPRLHLAMHEIVVTQLWDDNPPEVWDTAARLVAAGYDRHEILHMLAAPVAEQVWGTLHEDRPYDWERHRAALQALPDSWEKQRKIRTAERRHTEAGKGTRRAAKASGRRNRRPS